MLMKKSFKIVLMEHRVDYRAIYGLNLSIYLEAEVEVAKTIKEVISLVENGEIDLVFINNDAYSQDVAQDLWKIFEEREVRAELIVLGKTLVPQDYVTVFDSKIQLRDVLQSVARIMGVTSRDMVEKYKDEYYPLPMNFVVPGWQTNVDIFVRQHNEFIKVFNIEDVILSGELEYLEDGDLQQVFIKSKQRLKFANFITIQLSAQLNNPKLTIDERHRVTGVAYEMVMEQARQIGITTTTMDLANDCMKSMKAIVKGVHKLDKLLGYLLKMPTSYRYKQSLLINYIGSHILKKMKWASRDQLEVFTFCSFFHNIALYKDAYVKIRDDHVLEKHKYLTRREKELISKHALAAARLVSEVPDKIPYEATIILKQHHGTSSGIGFNNISRKISPLAMIFVLAEEWANIVLEYETETKRPSREEVYELIAAKYNFPDYETILPALRTLEI